MDTTNEEDRFADVRQTSIENAAKDAATRSIGETADEPTPVEEAPTEIETTPVIDETETTTELVV